MAILMVLAKHQDTIQDASMTHSMQAAAAQPMPLSAEQLAVLLPYAPLLAQVAQTLLDFRCGTLCPAATQKLEADLQGHFRELGRSALQDTLNSLEPAAAEQVPDELHVGGVCYRRRFKTPRVVDSTFGRLQLWRWLYEPRTTGERCLFPLELLIGLVAGRSTPALADRVGRLVAQYTQRDVLRILREENGVKWSHALLRETAAAVSKHIDGHRQAAQAKQVIGWLRQAHRGRGPLEPVLAVGRDGIMVPLCGGGPQEAAIATVAVYDRTGRRLGTVYLACMPEELQETLTRQLTALLEAILSGWKGTRPQLAYITDGGHVPEGYYKVLRKMADPCRPGERLQWVRVVDYYHATLYITKLAEALFGKSIRAAAWARRMRRTLKEAEGLKRVLQSASYYRNEQRLKGKRQEAFRKAYRYLWKRRRHMRYAALRAKGMPIGSGVTEAGCKVVASQRMKLSGMKWKKKGGQVVLTLRVAWLSGVWEQTWKAHIEEGTNMPSSSYGMCLGSHDTAAA
jgi:hypothetical protein